MPAAGALGAAQGGGCPTRRRKGAHRVNIRPRIESNMAGAGDGSQRR